MLSFPPNAAIFAIAGVVAAAGPVIIHLLNRRRFRVVHWAAMDFLLEAVKRNRRILHLRDLLLLALRTACVLLFGFALARPFFSSGADAGNSNEPIHAILVVDNSLSMGVQQLDKTLLDDAKAKAREFIDELPDGSRVSVLPLCGTPKGFSRDAYRTPEDAREALDKIEVVDRTGSALLAADMAREAISQAPDLTKRVVFIGDQQRINWPAGSVSDGLGELPDMQVVSVGPRDVENSWVEDFRVQDALADIETPATFTAVIRHEGASTRSNVQVTLTVDGAEVGSETVSLEPGQPRELTFSHRFDMPVEPGKAVFVPAKLTITPDRLPADDARYLAVPVVAAAKVVFVDQFGADEDPRKNRLGETRLLRRLLAPVVNRTSAAKQLVAIEHVRIEQVDRTLLADARLVVIAGIANPESAVEPLREYVQQGGQLVIAAGGDFDAGAWNSTAWQGGAGILPAPLKSQTVGKLPDEAGDVVRPFQIAPASLAQDEFHLAGVSSEELNDLYQLPFFFKAVEVDLNDDILKELEAADAKRIAEDRKVKAETTEREKYWTEQESHGKLTDADRTTREEEQARRDRMDPAWLTWRAPVPQVEGQTADDAAQLEQPRVLARFDNKLPFLVARQIGQGDVLLVTTSVFSKWNTLPKTNTMLLFDRLLRGMLEATLPRRNLTSVEQITLPVLDRNALYSVMRPNEVTEPLTVDALGADAYGVTLRDVSQRGIYEVIGVKGDASASEESSPTKLLDIKLAVDGPAAESDPAVLDEDAWRDRIGSANYQWVGPGDAIKLEGGQIHGKSLWKWLIAAVLLLLLVEIAVLARPMLMRERTV